MKLKTNIDDLEARLPDEFTYLEKKYPTVAFNVHDWGDGRNDRNRGKNILLTTEGYCTIPDNYNPAFMRQYDVTITSNAKIKEMYPDINIRLMNAPVRMDDFYVFEEFIPYDKKIKGICSIQKVYDTGKEGDINYLKHTVMRDLNLGNDFAVHTYGPYPFGRAESYKGYLGYKYNHYENFKKLNEYQFCWCPEPIYHPIGSYNWVTERLFNCFRSKTIAVYYGCYNIEDIVPTHLFVDYRQFKNVNELGRYLLWLSRDQKRYIDIVEMAYQWNLTCKLGDIGILEGILQDCVKKYPFTK